MKVSYQGSGLCTMGLCGIVLMVLHVTNQLVGWAWPFLYIFMILSAIGQENSK
jgi:hypothetical protein